MKVVHIITGLIQGGAERALYNLVKHDNSNIEHIIISLTDSGFFGKYIEDLGIECYYLEMPRRRLKLKSLINLYKIIKNLKPDIVQTWMYHSDLIGGIIAFLAGVKKIYWGVHNFNLDLNVTPLSTIITARLCGILSHIIPKKIIICSKQSISVHKKLFYRNIFEVINLGFDLSKFHFEEKTKTLIKKSINLCEKSLVIGCVARWDIIKDHENLIKSLKYIKSDKKLFDKIYLLFIGNNMTHENNELTEIIKENNLNEIELKLLGSKNNIDEFYSAMDVHILSSKGEAFPNVICEAMSSEVVCIGTDVGDVKNIIGNTGWIVPRSNPEQMGIAITNAINEFSNSVKWNEKRRLSRERIKNNFSMNKMINRYILVWKSTEF